MNHIVGIGGIAIAEDEKDCIITHALGSCVAVTFYDNITKVAAMIHIALPSQNSAPMNNEKMGYYADTGLGYLIDKLTRTYRFDFKRSTIYVVGGAKPTKTVDVFKIGENNLKAVRTTLNLKNISFIEQDVGGAFSRTVELNVRDGSISIKRQPLII